MNHSLALTVSLSFPLFNSGASGVKYFVLLMAYLMTYGVDFFSFSYIFLSLSECFQNLNILGGEGLFPHKKTQCMSNSTPDN